jgi:hypothetical protein
MAPSPNGLFLLFLIIVCEKRQIKISIYLSIVFRCASIEKDYQEKVFTEAVGTTNDGH